MTAHDHNRRRFLQLAALASASTAVGALIPGCGGGGGGGGGGSSGDLAGLRAIDPHAHPDQFHFGAAPKTDLSSTLSAIKSIKMAASSFAAIGDRNVADRYADVLSQLAYPIGLADAGKVTIVRGVADIPLESSATVPPGALLSVEGGDALTGDLDNVGNLYDLGVRIVTLVHYRNNEIGDIMREGSYDPGPYSGGLTEFGGQVVGEMESLGMLIDVAHMSTDTLTDFCAVAAKPFIDSHTSPSRTETPAGQTRLRTFAEMEMMVDKGGVICLWPLAYDHPTLPRRTFAHWAAEIVAMKAALGMEHVALGTDGSGGLPEMITGYAGISELPKLAAAMRDAGLTESDVAAFFGGNLLRVLGETIG